MDTRVAFNLFGLDVFWYGILLTTGMMLAVYMAAMELGRRGHSPQILWDGAILVLGLSVMGGRLYHVFSEYNDGTPGWSYYRQNPLEILNFRSGGLGVYGGIMLGAVGCIILCIRHKVHWGLMADCIAVGLMIGQCIGRWGNYANQELYGPPTSLPWGIPIAEWARTGIYRDLQQFPLTVHFHPSFLYESMWMLLGLIFLLWAERRFVKVLKNGDLFALYLLWYGVGRGLLESTVRLDALTYGGAIPTAVLFSLAFIAGGLLILFLNHVWPGKPLRLAPA